MITDSQFDTLNAIIKLVNLYKDPEAFFSFSIKYTFLPYERMRNKFDVFYKKEWHIFDTCQEAIEFLSNVKLDLPKVWDGEKTPMMIQQENAAMQLIEGDKE